MQKIGPIHDAQSLAHVVVGDEDTNPLVTKAANYFLHLAHADWIDSPERFVHQEKLWLGDESSADFEASTLATAQGKRLGPGQFLQA